jgi:hypothetical protein
MKDASYQCLNSTCDSVTARQPQTISHWATADVAHPYASGHGGWRTGCQPLDAEGGRKVDCHTDDAPQAHDAGYLLPEPKQLAGTPFGGVHARRPAEGVRHGPTQGSHWPHRVPCRHRHVSCLRALGCDAGKFAATSPLRTHLVSPSHDFRRPTVQL